MRMAKRWMALLILAGACEGQPAPRTAASANAQVAQAPWWCVDAADGFSSSCERALSDCESMNRRPRRRAGPCAPEPIAHCFRYVNRGLTINGTIVQDCSAIPTHCEDRRMTVVEALGPAKVLSTCETVR
jgi:hypothetical protein